LVKNNIVGVNVGELSLWLAMEAEAAKPTYVFYLFYPWYKMYRVLNQQRVEKKIMTVLFGFDCSLSFLGLPYVTCLHMYGNMGML